MADRRSGAIAAIDEGLVDLVINVPREYDELGRPVGYYIRRRAVDAGIPLITDLQLARALVEALRWNRSPKDLDLLGVGRVSVAEAHGPQVR